MTNCMGEGDAHNALLLAVIVFAEIEGIARCLRDPRPSVHFSLVLVFAFIILCRNEDICDLFPDPGCADFLILNILCISLSF